MPVVVPVVVPVIASLGASTLTRTGHLDLAVEVLDRVDRPQRQWLVQGELVLQVEVDSHPAAEFVGRVGKLEQPGVDQRPIDRDRPADVMTLLAARVVILDHQPAHRCAPVARSVEQAHHHLVIHVETRRQRFRGPRHELVERVLVPVGVPALGRLLLDELLALLGIGLGLLCGVLVADDVGGRLDPDVAPVVEALATGASGDLLELTHAEHPNSAPVVLAQLGEQHRADRHVDADAERVGAADDLQQARLGETFDEQPILRQQPGVVHADPADQVAAEALAERRIEPESADQLLDLLLLVLAERVQAEHALSGFGGLALGEVDEVDRGTVAGQQFLDRVMERGGSVGEIERNGAPTRFHGDRLAAGPGGQVALEEVGRTERRRHQQELATGHLQQGQLPCPSALRVGVEMELVGHDDVDRRVGAVPQRPVGQDLRGATDDRRPGIDAAVTGDHADHVGTERAAQLEELLRHQRLDRRRVDAALVAGERHEVSGDRHQRLPRSGRGVEDHVVAGDQLERGLLLGRVHLDRLIGDVRGESVQQGALVGGGRKVTQNRREWIRVVRHVCS